MTFYKYCRKYHIPFHINWTNPFQLSDYLEPNIVDWRCTLQIKDYRYASWLFVPMMMSNGDWNEYYKKQSRWFDRHMPRFSNQTIIAWGNARLVKRDECKSLFNELFRPTPLVQEQINKCLADLGDNFIGVTLRFQNLLGDFREADSQPIDEEQKKILMERCREKIREIHGRYPDDRILLTSDSRRFLDYMCNTDYIYTIPGKLVHMSFTDDHSFLTHLKPFVDLLVLSKARKIHLLVASGMYRSGFAQTASFIGGCEYEDIFL